MFDPDDLYLRDLDEKDPQQLLEKGVILLDPKMVQRAFDEGASPDYLRKESNLSNHPLQETLLINARFYIAPAGEDPKDAQVRSEKAARNDEIIDIILQQPLRTDLYDKLGLNYMDKLLYPIKANLNEQGIDKLAQALTSTIHDALVAGEEYEINYDGIFANIGDEEHPNSRKRRDAMGGIDAILNFAAARLRRPQTDKEHTLANSYSKSVQKWLDMLTPLVTTLPAPSMAQVAATLRVNEAQQAISRNMQAYMKAIRAEEDTTAAHKDTVEAVSDTDDAKLRRRIETKLTIANAKNPPEPPGNPPEPPAPK